MVKYLKDTQPMSLKERNLINELRVKALDIEAYYEGVDEEPNWEVKYDRIRDNMQRKVDESAVLATGFYDGNEGKILLAKNSYVLMSYHFLENYMSEFMWTKLGLFVANEVRSGIVLSFVMRDVLKKTKIDLAINGLSGFDLSETIFESSRILMKGQISVFTDIGALGLLNHRYGQDPFLNADWLTPEVRAGYAIQKQAEAALQAGNIKEYHDLQTESAIWFGAHEQLYTLAPLWSTDIMNKYADINIWVHNGTKGKIALFGDIFIGTNKFGEFLLGNVIKLSINTNNLPDGQDRIKIAMFGFRALNDLRNNPRWNQWIEYSEKKIGNQQGIYNINFRP